MIFHDIIVLIFIIDFKFRIKNLNIFIIINLEFLIYLNFVIKVWFSLKIYQNLTNLDILNHLLP